jgi:hypothetical protein
MNDPGHTEKIAYREGYSILWDENGMNIQTTDYHARTLHLSWKTVLDLYVQTRPNAHHEVSAERKIRKNI